MPRLDNFIALDGADKLASLEAFGLLLYAKFAIARVPPTRWRSQFMAAAPAESGSRDIATIRRVRLAILRALSLTVGADNCLPQALAARWMLERRGIPANLFIGTQCDADGKPRIHAWLKVGDEWVTGLCDEGRYTLIASGDAETA